MIYKTKITNQPLTDSLQQLKNVVHICGMLVVVQVVLTFHLPLSLSLPSIPPLSLSQVHTFDLNALSPGT